MNKTLAGALLGALLIVAPVTGAQNNAEGAAELQALRASAKTDKRALVASTLQLTPAEAKKFWPVYDTYQRQLDLVTRRRSVALEGLVSRDGPMSDLYAKNLTNELISVEEQEIKARRKLTNAVMRALPPKKAARYMQLEAKLRAAQDYEIAIVFPLVK